MSRLRRIYDDYYPDYFITAKTFENSRIFADEKKADLFLKVLNYLEKGGYFRLFAWVLWPDHFHLLLEIMEKKNISEVMKNIKGNFSWMLNHDAQTGKSGLRFGDKINRCSGGQTFQSARGNNQKIWQTSFYDHVIRNQNDFNNHINYIHYNPVKHGYVAKMEDWPWSSYHFFKK